MALWTRYTWWLGIMAGLAIFLGLAGRVQVLGPVQGLFLAVAQPLERLVGSIARPVANLLGDLGDLDEIRNENRALRLENEALQIRLTQLQGELTLSAELQQALDELKAEAPGSRQLATVVHRDASSFTDTISIDHGTSSGIKEGMVVLSAQGSLLGTVTRALPGQAFVRLITDSRSRVSGQVVETQAEGVVAGSLQGELTFTLVRAEVRPGDVITTSGIGGNYPPGIPVARVVTVEGTPQDLFRRVRLEPLVRPSTVQTVIVITGFLPAAGLQE